MDSESPNQPPPKPKKRDASLVEYLLILVFITIVTIAVLIELGHNVTSVFSTINSDLEVTPLDGTTTIAEPIGKEVMTQNGKTRYFLPRLGLYLGTDGKLYKAPPEGEVTALGPNGDLVVGSISPGDIMSGIQCFRKDDPQIHLGADGQYHYVLGTNLSPTALPTPSTTESP